MILLSSTFSFKFSPYDSGDALQIRGIGVAAQHARHLPPAGVPGHRVQGRLGRQTGETLSDLYSCTPVLYINVIYSTAVHLYCILL